MLKLLPDRAIITKLVLDDSSVDQTCHGVAVSVTGHQSDVADAKQDGIKA
jgi:hypothetical protein